MNKGYKQLVSEANATIRTFSPEEASAYLRNEDIAFVDLCDWTELVRDGKIPGAVHVSRGMLEFVLDPESPYHNQIFSSGKLILFYCASGGRSALATKTAKEMGLEQVAHISGGIKAWKEAGFPVESIH